MQNITPITHDILERQTIPAGITQELTSLAHIILNQNYFSYNNQCYDNQKAHQRELLYHPLFQNCTYSTWNTMKSITFSLNIIFLATLHMQMIF